MPRSIRLDPKQPWRGNSARATSRHLWNGDSRWHRGIAIFGVSSPAPLDVATANKTNLKSEVLQLAHSWAFANKFPTRTRLRPMNVEYGSIGRGRRPETKRTLRCDNQTERETGEWHATINITLDCAVFGRQTRHPFPSIGVRILHCRSSPKECPFAIRPKPQQTPS